MDAKPPSESHLRYARAWGVVSLLGVAVVVGYVLFGAAPAGTTPVPLSAGAGLILGGGGLAIGKGARARCREGWAWFAIGFFAIAALAACVAAGRLGIVR